MAGLKNVQVHTNFVNSLKRKQRTISTTATLTQADCIVICVTTAGAFTVTLGMTAAELVGQYIDIIDGPSDFAAANLTIDTAGAETIDGAATLVLSGDNDHRRIYSDGTNFFTLDGLS